MRKKRTKTLPPEEDPFTNLYRAGVSGQFTPRPQEPIIEDSGLILYKGVVHVSPFLIARCKGFERSVHAEFSFLLKAHLEKDGYIIEDGQIYVPEQEVSHSSVDYKEDLSLKREEGWNVILHAHPIGIRNFSSADTVTCYQFPIALLYCNGSITDAHISYPVDRGYVGFKPEIIMDDEIVTPSGSYLAKITKVKPAYYTIPPATPKTDPFDDLYLSDIEGDDEVALWKERRWLK